MSLSWCCAAPLACAQDLRHQMLNDIKALIDTPNTPGLIQFFGAFHVPGSGQVTDHSLVCLLAFMGRWFGGCWFVGCLISWLDVGLRN